MSFDILLLNILSILYPIQVVYRFYIKRWKGEKENNHKKSGSKAISVAIHIQRVQHFKN